MAKEYEIAFKLGADLQSTFIKSFTKASESIGRIEKQLKSIRPAAESVKNGVTGSFGAMAKSAVAAAAAFGAASLALHGVNSAMNFEAQIDSIQVLGSIADSEMMKVQKLALEMGAKTKYSALEAAQGMEELIKAGMSVERVMSGGLEAALNLATAGGLDLAAAAEIMSTAMNAYRKDGLAAADAANILAGTANASATGVEDLRISLAAVSSVAAGIGMSFRDTNIALGLFANNGLKGSDAGTSLKTMLSNLQPTTEEQIELFRELGLMTENGSNQFFTAEGRLKSLREIAGLLRSSMADLTDQERMLNLEILFGSDAIRSANILFAEGAEGVQKFNKEMSKTTALDVATAKMDNAKGAVEQFKGAIETLQISALLPTMPLIKKLALGAADLSSRLTEWLGSDQAEAWGNAISTAYNQVKGVFQGIGAFITDLGETAKTGGLGALIERIAGYFGLGSETAAEFTSIIKIGFKAGESAVESAIKVFQTVFPVIIQIGKTFGEISKEVISFLAPVASYLASKIYPIIAQVYTFIAERAIPAIASVYSANLPKIQAIVSSVIDGLKVVWGVVRPILTGLFALFNFIFPSIKDVVINAIHAIGGVISGLLTSLGGVIDFIVGVFTLDWERTWKGARDVFYGVFASLASILKFPLNSVIDLINRAIGGINKINIPVPDWVTKMTGVKGTIGFDIPEIPKLALGAFVNRPTIAEIGEGGYTEAVIPINNKPRSHALLDAANRMMGRSRSGGLVINPTYQITVSGGGDNVRDQVKQGITAGNEDLETRIRAIQKDEARLAF